MAKWHRAPQGEFQGVSKIIYGGYIGKICNCILVNMQISSEMLIGLTLDFTNILIGSET